MAAPSVPDVPKSGQPLQGQPPLTFFNINNADKSEEGGGADGDDDDADVPDREYTLEEIAACDGKGEDGTIYLAVCGKVFDVTAGCKFYGPGGPYENFAGRDATRGLGTFSLVPRKGKEHEPLTEKQIQNAARWIKLFKVKYKLIGRLKASPPPPPSAPATTKPASPPPTPKKQRSNSRTCRIL